MPAIQTGVVAQTSPLEVRLWDADTASPIASKNGAYSPAEGDTVVVLDLGAGYLWVAGTVEDAS